LRDYQSWFPPYELVTDLSPDNLTLDVIQTLADQRADLIAMVGGVSYARCGKQRKNLCSKAIDRYAFVDFSTPVFFFDVNLFSGMAENEGGGGVANVVQGVFDVTTYSLLAICMSLIAMIATIPSPSKTAALSLPESFLSSYGILAGQSLLNGLTSKAVKITLWAGGLLGMITMSSVFIGALYGSEVVSRLSVKVDQRLPNSLEDLGRRPFSHLSIYVEADSYVLDVVSKLKAFKAIEDRVVYTKRDIDLKELEEVLLNVYRGTHVIIDGENNFEYKVRLTYYRAPLIEPL